MNHKWLILITQSKLHAFFDPENIYIMIVIKYFFMV